MINSAVGGVGIEIRRYIQSISKFIGLVWLVLKNLQCVVYASDYLNKILCITALYFAQVCCISPIKCVTVLYLFNQPHKCSVWLKQYSYAAILYGKYSMRHCFDPTKQSTIWNAKNFSMSQNLFSPTISSQSHIAQQSITWYIHYSMSRCAFLSTTIRTECVIQAS